MKLDHVGFVTNDIEKFEAFWVKVLGAEKIFESNIPAEMNHALFGCKGAYCARYKVGEFTIEVHVYYEPVKEDKRPFNVFGINHIALHVDSREEFLKKYDFTKHVYHNPKGWDNIFIEDFEGNWIEVRTKL